MSDDAATWGLDDRRRLSVRDVPACVLARVDARQGGRRCAVPSCPVVVPLELDHRRPLSRGGDNHWSNLQWLCREHNRRKGAGRG